jgi:peptidylprolyl isomerase domain and WD repeat-containing protein 1
MQRGQAQAKLAISDAESGTVHVYDARSGSNDPVGSFSGHRQPVQVMRFNEACSTVISVDARGAQMIGNAMFSFRSQGCML